MFLFVRLPQTASALPPRNGPISRNFTVEKMVESVTEVAVADCFFCARANPGNKTKEIASSLFMSYDIEYVFLNFFPFGFGAFRGRRRLLQRGLRLRGRRHIGLFQDAKDTRIIVLKLREGPMTVGRRGRAAPPPSLQTGQNCGTRIQLLKRLRLIGRHTRGSSRYSGPQPLYAVESMHGPLTALIGLVGQHKLLPQP